MEAETEKMEDGAAHIDFRIDSRNGSYDLTEELAHGSSTRVWRAWDHVLECEVAIKELLLDACSSDDERVKARLRFIQEAKAAAHLRSHPGIATIYSVDEYAEHPFVVIEPLEGIALDRILASGIPALEDTVSVLDQLLDAVGYAHGQGVIHRAITPANIFVDTNGHVKLIDFGFPRLDDDLTSASDPYADTSGILGYMSPEQAVGAPLDERSDLFAIGIIAYEMITGQNPFGASEDADPTSVFTRTVYEPAFEPPPDSPDVANLSQSIWPAIMTALEKVPADRPQSAAEFKAMLHGEPTENSGGSTFLATAYETMRSQNRRWLSYTLIGVICIAAILAILLFAIGSCSSRSATSNPNGDSPEPTSQSSSGTESIEFHLSTNTDGFLSLYVGDIGDRSTPTVITDVNVADLDSDDAASLKKGIQLDDMQAANEQIERFRAAAAVGKEARLEAEAAAAAQEEEAKRLEEEEAEAIAAQQEADATAILSQSDDADYYSFWAVWIGEFPDSGGAYARADEARAAGLDATVYKVVDWYDPYSALLYRVGIGQFDTFDEAGMQLVQALDLGYSDAYVNLASYA